MENVEDKTQDCGYCSVTIIALLIAVFSAGVTLMIANYMYNGSYEPIWPNEIISSAAEKIIVPHKKVMIVKVQPKNRCYVFSLNALKTYEGTFTIGNTPLSRETLQEVADTKGVEFCSNAKAFILERNH